jgi:hypothetical protein
VIHTCGVHLLHKGRTTKRARLVNKRSAVSGSSGRAILTVGLGRSKRYLNSDCLYRFRGRGVRAVKAARSRAITSAEVQGSNPAARIPAAVAVRRSGAGLDAWAGTGAARREILQQRDRPIAGSHLSFAAVFRRWRRPDAARARSTFHLKWPASPSEVPQGIKNGENGEARFGVRKLSPKAGSEFYSITLSGDCRLPSLHCAKYFFLRKSRSSP